MRIEEREDRLTRPILTRTVTGLISMHQHRMLSLTVKTRCSTSTMRRWLRSNRSFCKKRHLHLPIETYQTRIEDLETRDQHPMSSDQEEGIIQGWMSNLTIAQVIIRCLTKWLSVVQVALMMTLSACSQSMLATRTTMQVPEILLVWATVALICRQSLPTHIWSHPVWATKTLQIRSRNDNSNWLLRSESKRRTKALWLELEHSSHFKWVQQIHIRHRCWWIKQVMPTWLDF